MQTKFLKDAVGSIVGKQMEPLVDILNGDNYVNEFLIAKKLGIEINQTRNILYRLTDYGLVSSTRKKDARKGWYTYFWKIEVLKSLEFLETVLEKKISEFKNQIKSRETKLFYVCETCNVEYNEENAMLNNFTCNECGNVFIIKDNSKNLKDFKKELDFLEKQLVLLNLELDSEKSKEDKKRVRVIKKDKKEKDKKSKEKRLKRKKEKEKLVLIANKGKKIVKPKKKVVKKSTKGKNKKQIVKKSVKKSSKKKRK